jgi:hypothetical protein
LQELTTRKFHHASSDALAALAATWVRASYPRSVAKPTDILKAETGDSPRHFVSLRNA